MVLPDGMYVIPLWLYRMCDNRRRSWLDERDGHNYDVRVRILGGVQVSSNFNVRYEGESWYKSQPDGRNAAEGHTYIDTAQQLIELCTALPYANRS